MKSGLLRPVLMAASITAAAGILAGGLALRPAFATGGTAIVGPFTITNCSKGSPCKTYNNAGTGAGLQGKNTNASGTGAGLIGTATSGGYGVLGQASSNNAIMGTSNSGDGVAGNSSSNVGVSGYSTNWYGVMGQSVSEPGIDAFSSSSTGLQAASGSGVPIVAISESSAPAIESFGSTGLAYYGITSSGNGADIQGTYIGVLGRSPDCSGGTTYPFVATDQHGNNLMFTDCAGNMYIHGGYGNFSKTRGGNIAMSFTSKVASPTVEDTGTGHLVNGIAMVQLDPAFAHTIDASQAYHVMLTPDGDTRGLFVASKSPTGFLVREVQGGRGTLDFDYHIYAPALGQAGVRMTEMSQARAAAMMPHANVTQRLRPRNPVLHQ
jgi:hypothetical protein